MRDPNRIPEVLKKVEELWQRHPDWRLGQLIANVAAWRETDVWNLEEDELSEEIERHLRQSQHATETGN